MKTKINNDKIDLLSRRVLERLPEEQMIGFFLFTDSEMTAAERAEVEQAGGTIELAIGNMATASAKAKDVIGIADLDFVEAIEISRVLFPEDITIDETHKPVKHVV